tara:strand:- start:573 stop:1139 length:567 start_codon:yes stop_codon:yes gene_type:complete
MLTEIDVSQLADAFPMSMRTNAVEAGKVVHGLLDPRQWAKQVSLLVGGEKILVPRRLRYSEAQSASSNDGRIAQMAACLQTQSSNGFDRQRALRSLLPAVQPWSAPFVITLIGEYVVEIIEDIAGATTPSNVDAMISFISENCDYWELTKQRVASYWNAYYRHKHTKLNYPGFQLVRTLETSLRARAA